MKQIDYRGLWVLTVTILAVLVLAFIDSLAKKADGLQIEWETLLVGSVATLVAVVTVRVINNQTKLQHKQHSESLDRKRWAAQARLPDALSDLVKYCKDVASALNDPQAPLPEPPHKAIEAIKRAIEHVDNETSKELSLLIVFYQIHNSRLIGFFDEEKIKPITGSGWDQRMQDVAKLHALTTRLFDYARPVDSLKDGLSAAQLESSLVQSVGLVDYYKEEDKYASILKRIRNRL